MRQSMEELRRLKIGRRCYRIRHRELDPNLYGQIGIVDGLLDLADDLEGEEAVYALIHEALHGIWHQRKLAARAREERAVTELAWGLTGVLRDNPGLSSYLERELESCR